MTFFIGVQLHTSDSATHGSVERRRSCNSVETTWLARNRPLCDCSSRPSIARRQRRVRKGDLACTHLPSQSQCDAGACVRLNSPFSTRSLRLSLPIQVGFRVEFREIVMRSAHGSSRGMTSAARRLRKPPATSLCGEVAQDLFSPHAYELLIAHAIASRNSSHKFSRSFLAPHSPRPRTNQGFISLFALIFALERLPVAHQELPQIPSLPRRAFQSNGSHERERVRIQKVVFGGK